MNGKKRKAKKASEGTPENVVKRRRDKVQEEILSKARPFIKTTTADRPSESGKSPEKLSKAQPQKIPKRQKRPKAQKEKNIKAKGPTPQVPPEEQKTRALDYLKAWHDKAENWKFSKKRQIWLLRNLYQREKISDENFPIMLEYLGALAGSSRKQLVSHAEGIFNDCEKEMQELGSEIPESCKIKYNRARQVVQML